MHHKNSIISTLMGGFLALSLAACEDPKPPYPDGSYPTTTLQNGPTTTTLQNGPTTTTMPPIGTTTTTSTTTTAPTTTVCATHSVIMNNFQFSPKTLTIKRCDTVTWTHQQSVPANTPHSVTSGQVNGGNAGQVFDSTGGQGFGNLMQLNATFSHTFNSAGPFPYHCIVHGSGGMTGTITVSP